MKQLLYLLLVTLCIVDFNFSLLSCSRKQIIKADMNPSISSVIGTPYTSLSAKDLMNNRAATVAVSAKALTIGDCICALNRTFYTQCRCKKGNEERIVNVICYEYKCPTNGSLCRTECESCYTACERQGTNPNASGPSPRPVKPPLGPAPIPQPSYFPDIDAGPAVIRLDIVERKTLPNGVRSLVLSTPTAQFDDLNIGLRNFRLEIYDTGETKWTAEIAKQNPTSASCRVYFNVLSSINNFLDRIPQGTPKSNMQHISKDIDLKYGTAVLQDWNESSARMDGALWPNISYVDMLVTSHGARFLKQ